MSELASRIFKVEYHGGELFALVEAATPEEALDCARALRIRQYKRRHRELVSAIEDTYVVTDATARDIEWCASFGIRPVRADDNKVREVVRAARLLLEGHPTTRKAPNAPGRALPQARMGFPIVLSDRWRISDDPVQWILQTRVGKGRTLKSGGIDDGWRNRRFHTDRKTVLRDIRELIGEVSPEALAAVEALPEKHPGFMAHVAKSMEQYRKENPRAGRGRARAGDWEADQVSGEGKDPKRASGALSVAA